jgi:hypothetical protein
MNANVFQRSGDLEKYIISEYRKSQCQRDSFSLQPWMIGFATLHFLRGQMTMELFREGLLMITINPSGGYCCG